MRRTVVLSASAALAVLVLGVAALLFTQQEAQAQEPCATSYCIDKTIDQSTVTVGDQITFTITQRCQSLGYCTTSAPLVDQLPAGLTDVIATPTSGVYVDPESGDFVSVLDPQSTYECTTSGNTVTCPGTRILFPQVPFTLTVVATTTECGTFTNTASSGPDSGTATYTVEGCPPPLPTTKEQCKNGGWRDYGYPDQGTCITDVNQRAGRT